VEAAATARAGARCASPRSRRWRPRRWSTAGRTRQTRRPPPARLGVQAAARGGATRRGGGRQDGGAGGGKQERRAAPPPQHDGQAESSTTRVAAPRGDDRGDSHGRRGGVGGTPWTTRGACGHWGGRRVAADCRRSAGGLPGSGGAAGVGVTGERRARQQRPPLPLPPAPQTHSLTPPPSHPKAAAAQARQTGAREAGSRGEAAHSAKHKTNKRKKAHEREKNERRAPGCRPSLSRHLRGPPGRCRRATAVVGEARTVGGDQNYWRPPPDGRARAAAGAAHQRRGVDGIGFGVARTTPSSALDRDPSVSQSGLTKSILSKVSPEYFFRVDTVRSRYSAFSP